MAESLGNHQNNRLQPGRVQRRGTFSEELRSDARGNRMSTTTPAPEVPLTSDRAMNPLQDVPDRRPSLPRRPRVTENCTCTYSPGGNLISRRAARVQLHIRRRDDQFTSAAHPVIRIRRQVYEQPVHLLRIGFHARPSSDPTRFDHRICRRPWAVSAPRSRRGSNSGPREYTSLIVDRRDRLSFLQQCASFQIAGIEPRQQKGANC